MNAYEFFKQAVEGTPVSVYGRSISREYWGEGIVIRKLVDGLKVRFEVMHERCADGRRLASTPQPNRKRWRAAELLAMDFDILPMFLGDKREERFRLKMGRTGTELSTSEIESGSGMCLRWWLDPPEKLRAE